MKLQFQADQAHQLEACQAIVDIFEGQPTGSGGFGVELGLPSGQLQIGSDLLIGNRLALAEDSGTPTAYLRTIEDSDRLKVAFDAGARVAVVGGGWIGLEVAAAARTAGCPVTLFEQADLPLLGVLGPEIGRAHV